MGIGDTRTVLRRWWVIGLLALGTWLLSLPLFEPFSWWPFGFVVFVPWLVALGASARPVWIYVVSYLLGSAFFLFHLHWLATTTREGYVAAAVGYLAWYFVLAVWPIRYAHLRWRLPMTVVFPIVWVAVELLRSRGMLAFPWFLLGHSQARATIMIQIADLAGVAGVSLVVAAVNGWLADWWLEVLRGAPGTRWRPRRATAIQGTVVAAVVLATLIYGRVRTTSPPWQKGPLISVVQGDFLLAAVRGAGGASEAEKMGHYLRYMAEASEAKPDMIVLPETPWGMYLNKEIREAEPMWNVYHEAFRNRAEGYGTYITVGGISQEPQPPGAYPEAHRYNSAFVYAPDDPEPLRYDKIHLVPFGEYVPFRYSKHFFWLYRFLNDSWFNPWGAGGYEYSLTVGDEYTTFPLSPRTFEHEPFRFAVTICYEDVIPFVFRRFVTDDQGVKRVDFMLNISNDGWFGRGWQQPQHMVNCAFRAVENRVGVARAANTGVSGFIRPDGTWYSLMSPSDDKPRAGGLGTRTARVVVDPRVTVYSRYGDVLAWACVLLVFGEIVIALVVRQRSRNATA